MQEIRVFLKQQEAQSAGGVKSFTAGQSVSSQATRTDDTGAAGLRLKHRQQVAGSSVPVRCTRRSCASAF